ncbi:MAG: methylated-DNA--[protein]-cysteine S-methyltransferase [Gemmatimonadota bacterium]
MNFTTFETALGTCGIAWTARGIRRIQLPERRRGQTAARLKEALPDFTEAEVPAWVREVMVNIRGYLDGSATLDVANISLDLDSAPAFHQAVYAVARDIPIGTTRTYGELASLAGKPGASRAVGQAMARNPIPLIVPCHRIVAAHGKPGGFSPAGGIVTKAQLLALEGVVLPGLSGQSSTPPTPLPYDAATALTHLRNVDPKLARVLDAAGPFRLSLDKLQSPFAALAESIVYQQLTGKAAATIHGRLVALVKPKRRLRPDDVLLLTVEQLRSAGLSRAKVAALQDLAAKTIEGIVPSLARLRNMDDAEIIERLTSIRGIGRWTVEMLLIFRLGRPDVLPVTDYGVQKGFKIAYNKRKLPTPKRLGQYGKRWAPYRSVAAWYLWRAADQKKVDSG